jgi:hypothetical protein
VPTKNRITRQTAKYDISSEPGCPGAILIRERFSDEAEEEMDTRLQIVASIPTRAEPIAVFSLRITRHILRYSEYGLDDGIPMRGRMTSEGKAKGQAARHGAGRPILERLKPEEAAAVLRRLLEIHPDLSSEAEEMARSLLRQVEYEEIAAEIEDEIRALDYDALNARAGSHEWGYVEPSEAAEEILEETVEPFLEDMKRDLELGLEMEALEICKGLVLGCYRLSEREGGDVLGWAPDFPAEAAGNALEVWYAGTDDPKKSRDQRRNKCPSLPPDFLNLVPKWIPMIERVGKETK